MEAPQDAAAQSSIQSLARQEAEAAAQRLQASGQTSDHDDHDLVVHSSCCYRSNTAPPKKEAERRERAEERLAGKSCKSGSFKPLRTNASQMSF